MHWISSDNMKLWWKYWTFVRLVFLSTNYFYYRTYVYNIKIVKWTTYLFTGSGEGLENSKQNQRWNYAQLNAQSMGVLSSPQTEKEVSCEKKTTDSPLSEVAKSDNSISKLENTKTESLVDGWEMHEDEGGLYFWHVKSGTIQREVPSAMRVTPRLTKSSTSSQVSKLQSSDQQRTSNSDLPNPESVEQKRKSLPPPASTTSPAPIGDDPQTGMQVRVKALGSIQLSEESLTNENSSRAVNRCIVQLSGTHETPLSDAGQDLILALNEGTLKLIDPRTNSVVQAQPIHTIRVWGVGRDDGRDFAYVARDKATRCHTCHVFRCDVPARAIANRLRDICKKILIERSLTQSSSKLIDQDQINRRESASSRASSVEDTSASGAAASCSTPPTSSLSAAGCATAPGSSNLIRPTHFTTKLKTKTVSRAPESFPTPMEEPKKIIKAKFIGELEVSPITLEYLENWLDSCLYYSDAAQRAKFAKRVHKPPLGVNVINFELKWFNASIRVPWSPFRPIHLHLIFEISSSKNLV